MKAHPMPARTATKKTPAKPAPAKRPTARPTARPNSKAFSSVVVLAPGAELLAAEAELRLRSIARHLGAPVPPVVRVAELETTPEATGLALYRAFRAVGRGGPVLYLVASNAQAGALCALTTDWGNTILAANDGTLAMLVQLFSLRGIPFTLTELDVDALTATEQRRMDNPEWQPAPDFALRDVLAPAAAQVLSGTPANHLARPTSTKTKAAPALVPQPTRWSKNLATLPLGLGEKINALALPQPDGTWLLNLTLDPLSFDQLLDDRAGFTLKHPHRCRWLNKLGLMHCHKLVVHGTAAPTTSCCAGGTCGSSCCGSKNTCANHLHLSPLQAPVWDERLLSITLGSCGHACLCGCHSSCCSGSCGAAVPVVLVRTQ
jgi:hypothetical protein